MITLPTNILMLCIIVMQVQSTEIFVENQRAEWIEQVQRTVIPLINSIVQINQISFLLKQNVTKETCK
jgi:hypothetical protein